MHFYGSVKIFKVKIFKVIRSFMLSVVSTAAKYEAKRICEAERKHEEPTDHHQSQYSRSSVALFATDSLELKLA